MWWNKSAPTFSVQFKFWFTIFINKFCWTAWIFVGSGSDPFFVDGTAFSPKHNGCSNVGSETDSKNLLINGGKYMQLRNLNGDKYPIFPSMLSCFHTKKDATWPESGYLDHRSGRSDVCLDQHFTVFRILPSTTKKIKNLDFNCFVTS